MKNIVIIGILLLGSAMVGFAKDKILLEEPAIIYLDSNIGEKTAIEGSVILTKKDCVLKFNNKITIQQNLKIDKLTIPIESMKDVKVINEGKSFEYFLGGNRNKVDSDSSTKIVDLIMSLQKR